MIARVTAIESGIDYIDKKRRVTIKFEEEDSIRAMFTVREESLGLREPVQLDQEIVVEFGRGHGGLQRNPLTPSDH